MHLEMSSDSARVLPAIQMIGYPTTMTFLMATMMRTSVSYYALIYSAAFHHINDGNGDDDDDDDDEARWVK